MNDDWEYDDTQDAETAPVRPRSEREDVPAGRKRRQIDGGKAATAYRTLRRQFRRTCEAERRPCHYCHRPIDYSLKHGESDWAWELDHAIPVSLLERAGTPERALDPSGFRASHSLCNKLGRSAVLDGLPAGGNGGAPTDLAGAMSELGYTKGEIGQLLPELRQWGVTAGQVADTGCPSERW